MKFLVLLIFMVGYFAGWLARGYSIARRRETEQMMAEREEYKRIRDAQFPEMIGKWGKP